MLRDRLSMSSKAIESIQEAILARSFLVSRGTMISISMVSTLDEMHITCSSSTLGSYNCSEVSTPPGSSSSAIRHFTPTWRFCNEITPLRHQRIIHMSYTVSGSFVINKVCVGRLSDMHTSVGSGRGAEIWRYRPQGFVVTLVAD
jgi:hypothetical protein